jgi:hypothetical protein
MDSKKKLVFISQQDREAFKELHEEMEKTMLEYLIGYKAGTYNHFMTQFKIRHPEWEETKK